MEYIQKFILADGEPKTDFTRIENAETIIYEVIRVTEGIPMFVEKHLQRLKNSASILSKKLSQSEAEFKELIQKLIIINDVFTGNFKISIIYGQDDEALKTIIGFIPHKYPPEEDYRNGVKTISSINYRLNPNAKVQQEKLRNDLNLKLNTTQAYEAILVHPEGYITEGSRSNLFFIRGNQIITAPDQQILSGITRENVIQLCKENQFDLELRTIFYSELSTFDGAFITGTSPKVLPVKTLDNCTFDLPNAIIGDLILKYDEMIQLYIQSKKR